MLRISGPEAGWAVRMLAGVLPEPRVARLAKLADPANGEVLDRALILWFPAPRSATGEDVAELHVHGGRAVLAAVERALAAIPGLRPAEPGEFTRRALSSGRIDLAEAEGLGDLLMAETESQRRRAQAAVDGVVSKAVAGWAGRVLALAARVEAALDFADEDDVEPELGHHDLVARDSATLAHEMRAVLDEPPIERLRDGIRVVLAGPPNSGKSTLFNVLVDRDAAIVSPIAGTTRDRIEAPVVRDGIAYLLIDTAGLADATDDPIEAVGIDRSRKAMVEADLVLWLDDVPPPPSLDAIWLFPRADDRETRGEDRLAVSALTGAGMSALWLQISERAKALLPREDRLAVNRRQRALIEAAAEALEAAAHEGDVVLRAEWLRLARAALDRITGTSGVEDMLDALFGRFCIGK
uniref:tRNA uridine-5-carboxymethylaminomethyl(34) synthesis GTPase MnmE n=1 Tax=Sphingomonas sp. GlSt437 TaxID=3389970 RepID=UPI003A8BB6E6